MGEKIILAKNADAELIEKNQGLLVIAPLFIMKKKHKLLLIPLKNTIGMRLTMSMLIKLAVIVKFSGQPMMANLPEQQVVLFWK